MNPTAYLIRYITRNDGWYCPACGDKGLHKDDMDLGEQFTHSDEMRAKYGAACCVGCSDDHITTEDGVLMRCDAAIKAHDGTWWSSEDALADADYEADCETRDRAMMGGWR